MSMHDGVFYSGSKPWVLVSLPFRMIRGESSVALERLR